MQTPMVEVPAVEFWPACFLSLADHTAGARALCVLFLVCMSIVCV
jgi:hypothetical protein